MASSPRRTASPQRLDGGTPSSRHPPPSVNPPPPSSQQQQQRPESALGATPPPSSSSSSCSTGDMKVAAANVAGTLRVEVLAARNLHAAVLGSLLKWTPSYSNPFVAVSLRRDEFLTTVKEKTLNPSWKETGELAIPLPTEQELLQTVGVSAAGGALAVSGAHVAGAAKKLSDTPGEAEFHACFPCLRVQVFHRADEPDGAESAARGLSSAPTRRATDKLIGEVSVPLLPCLLSSASSHRAWYTLSAEDLPDAGQIQLAMNYDCGGMEPLKGDVVRLTGFGGLEYYAKLLPVNARLEVVETFQDQVLAQCKSIEGWTLSFELHRNLLFVVRRPSILRDAQSQLQGQITRVRHSPLVLRARGVWLALPDAQRRQLWQLYQLAAFSGGVVYDVVTRSLQATLHDGVHAGLQTCAQGSSEAVDQVTAEFVRVFWLGSTRERREGGHAERSRTDDMRQSLEGGPAKGRGRIVEGFGGEDGASVSAEIEWRVSTQEDEDAEEDKRPERAADEEEEEEEKQEDSDADNEDDDGRVSVPLESCPDQLICPITGCPMADPVVAADGHTYEREAILHWFATSNKSPMTGMQMPTTQVFPNFTLRQLSEEFQAARARQAERRHQHHAH
ncbi:hypothetical protein ATCC90586_004078 [Pythium insidiosum]|nr:hypothetical protein ATCC90586_004078 [Pythium insidiosum]